MAESEGPRLSRSDPKSGYRFLFAWSMFWAVAGATKCAWSYAFAAAILAVGVANILWPQPKKGV